MQKLFGIKERVHEPFYETLLSPAQQVLEDAKKDDQVHWVMPEAIAAFERGLWFDGIELKPGFNDRLPGWQRDHGEGDYWAFGYLKGETVARGRTPDEAAYRLCDKMAERGDVLGWGPCWEPHVLRSMEEINQQLRMPG